RPVGFLIMMLLGAAMLVWQLRAPRLTWRGARIENRLRSEHAALELTAKSAPEQLDGTEMTLAYGLFGYLVAPTPLLLAMPSFHAAMVDTSSSAGSSCSSSCGSSCGGGCGGGCGGCGS